MGWLHDRWRKKFVRDAFKRYVSEEALQRIEKGEWPPQPSATRKLIHFAIFQIKDEDPVDVQASLNALVPLIFKNKGMVMGLPTVKLAMFEDASKMWVDELSLALQSPDLRAKGLFGQVECLVGNWGSPILLSYGPLIPGFGRLLARLDSQDYGSFEPV
jgi:hypothetical protein